MKRLPAALVLFLIVLSAGCIYDPSEVELAKGKNIDISRMQGVVVSKDTRYFVGDQPSTMEDKGKPYYCITIQPYGRPEKTEYCGVPTSVFDTVSVNLDLADPGMLSEQQLKSTISGTVVDKIAWPINSTYYIVVDDGRSIRSYRVPPDLYYRALVIGAQLPLIQ